MLWKASDFSVDKYVSPPKFILTMGPPNLRLKVIVHKKLFKIDSTNFVYLKFICLGSAGISSVSVIYASYPTFSLFISLY